MAKLARQGSKNMMVRGLAVELTTAGFWDGTGLRQKDFSGEASTLFAYVRDEIRYVRDIADVETLHDAATILQQGAGDCDDKCILLAALLLSIGFEHIEFVAIAFAPNEFSHVWLRAWVDDPSQPAGGAWVDMEPTEPVPYGATIPTDGAADIVVQEV